MIEDMERTAVLRDRLLLAAAVVGAWLLLALAWTPPTVLVDHRGPAPAALFDGRVFMFLLTGFLPWMAATPLLLRLARLFPIARGRPLSLAVHVAAGLIVIPTASIGGRLLASMLLEAGDREALSLFPAAAITALYSLPTYVAVAAIGQGLAWRSAQRKADLVVSGPEAPPFRPKRLAIRDKGRTELITLTEIDYIDVAGHYLCVHAGGAVHVTRGQLSALERQLEPGDFARIHRSTMVRLDRVRAIEERRNGDCDLILADGRRLLLSRLYRDSLRTRLGLPGL